MKFSPLPCLLFAAFAAFVSCNSLLVEPDPKSSPERNFEIFWSDIYNTYPYFQKDQVDWLEVYHSNKPRVTSSTSDAELFDILKGMLSLLSDAHRSLLSADKKMAYYPSRPRYAPNYDSLNIFGTYLKNTLQKSFAQDQSTPAVTQVVSDHGITDEGILYYHLRTYFTKFSFEKDFNTLRNRYPDSKGLILDLRNNGGGSISTLLNFLSLFFDKPTEYIVIKQKTGPLENNFAPPENFTIQPARGYAIYTKPIVVLTNRYSASAAEHTVLAMKQRMNTQVVGDTTYGAFSFVLQRTLPNGMQFECVSTQATDIRGVNYEGTGIPPHIYTRITAAAYAQNKDDLMEKAIELLK